MNSYRGKVQFMAYLKEKILILIIYQNSLSNYMFFQFFNIVFYSAVYKDFSFDKQRALVFYQYSVLDTLYDSLLLQFKSVIQQDTEPLRNKFFKEKQLSDGCSLVYIKEI